MAIAIPSGRVRFATFEVDLRSGELHKQGIKIKLHDQPFQALAMLLEHPGKLVTREQLHQKLWPSDTFVDFDVGLNSAIKRLRDALGDSAESPRFVETLPRRGYRFIAQVEEVLAGTGGREAQRSPAPGGVTPGGASVSTEPRAAALSPHQPELEKNRTKTTRVRYLLLLGGVAAAILLALLFGLNAVGLRERLLGKASAGGAAAGRIRSLAVLPLENLSRDADQEYFVDGMTETLITDLGKIAELRVISQTSVMRYKATKKSLAEIARELQVDAFVEGTVVRSGDHVRITANLVQASPEKVLWAESFERDLRDVLALQDDVSQAIANWIRVRLTPQEQARLASAHPVNPEAYEAYLESRYFTHNQRSPEGARKSIEASLEAVRIAPDWAPAYSGLADSYIQAAFLAALPPNEAVPRAKVAARRALELDPALSEAHVALGWILSSFDYEYSGSEREFKRAIELSPSSSYAHQAYADLLNGVGRPDEAITEIKLARQLDPVSFFTSRDVGLILYDARRYDEALEALRQAADLNPASGVVYNWMSWIYDKKGMAAQSVEMDLRNDGNRGASQEVLQELREAYRVSGERGYLKKHLELIKDDPYEQALYSARLGETEKTLQLLRQACEEHSGWLGFMKVDPELDNLRPDPGFRELLHRINLASVN